MPDIYDRIQQAVDETAQMQRQPYPSMLSVVANHPGFLGHQILSDEEYQQKLKYAALMERLQKIQEEDAQGFNQAVIYQEPAVNRYTGKPYMRDVVGRELEFDDIDRSPYRERGVLSPGMPLRNAFDVMQVPFSVAANTARGLYAAGVNDMPMLDRAAKAAPEVANKATGGIWNAVQGKDPNEAWAQERAAVASIPFSHPLMYMGKGNPGAILARDLPPLADNGIVEGPQVLKEDFDFPDNWKTDMAGYALEAAMDPAFGMTSGIRHLSKAVRAAAPAAKAAHALRAGSLFGQEMAMPATWVGIGEANRRMEDE
jgi:hypothetical protein